MREVNEKREGKSRMPDGDGVFGHGVGSWEWVCVSLCASASMLGRGRQVIIFKSFFSSGSRADSRAELNVKC